MKLRIIKNKRYRVEKDGEVVGQYQYKKEAKKKLKKVKEKEKKKVVTEPLKSKPSKPKPIKKPISKKCVWKTYIRPKLKIKEIKGTLHFIPRPPAPKAKFKDYEKCEWLSLDDASSYLRSKVNLKKISRLYFNREYILHWSGLRGIKLKRRMVSEGRFTNEVRYVPKPMLDEMLANFESDSWN